MAVFNLTEVYNLLQPKLSTFKPSTFYEYTLKGENSDGGDEYHIGDGGHDMYDTGNYTTIINYDVNDTTNTKISSNLSYATTTSAQITVKSSVSYISLGYARPLIMLATSASRGSWGFRKHGDLGSDGSTSSAFEIYNLYQGSTINGFTVYAYSFNWWVDTTSTNAANDPTITDVFFHIGKTGSTFHSTTPVKYNTPSPTNYYETYLTMDTTNTLFGCILLSTYSETSQPVITTLANQQAVITSIVNLLVTTIASTLFASPTTFYRKFVSGATISFNISSNAGVVPRTHESNDAAVVTIPTSATPSASIAGPGKTTIKVTQPATTTYAEIINNALITIIVVGQGKTYTSETFPASFDLAGTNLTGSTFNSCNLTSANLTNANVTNSVFSGSTDLTSANLFGATVNSSTSFTTSTLTGITSGRITGVTSLLPAGFTMI